MLTASIKVPESFVWAEYGITMKLLSFLVVNFVTSFESAKKLLLSIEYRVYLVKRDQITVRLRIADPSSKLYNTPRSDLWPFHMYQVCQVGVLQLDQNSNDTNMYTSTEWTFMLLDSFIRKWILSVDKRLIELTICPLIRQPANRLQTQSIVRSTVAPIWK